MESLISGSLRIEAQLGQHPAPIRLMWLGKSDDRNPALALAPYFKGVLALAAARQLAIELHFEQLQHFNSSTISSIIRLLEDARRGGIRLVIHYDGESRWQRLSLEQLRVFTNDLLELRPVARGGTA